MRSSSHNAFIAIACVCLLAITGCGAAEETGSTQPERSFERTVNLGVFIFIVTSVVFVTQHAFNPKISNYVDALYFTITTLTTTGFGDITLEGPGGRVLAIVIMFVGVGLFLRLLQAVFRPNKVRFDCPDCGLLVHDVDAVHCKHCGRVLHIPDEGVS